MSVQMMNPNRTFLISDEPISKESEKIAEDFFACSGHYDVNEKTHTVTHHLEMALLPNMVGNNYQRFYRFEVQYLYLTVSDSQKGQALRWEKVV